MMLLLSAGYLDIHDRDSVGRDGTVTLYYCRARELYPVNTEKTCTQNLSVESDWDRATSKGRMSGAISFWGHTRVTWRSSSSEYISGSCAGMSVCLITSVAVYWLNTMASQWIGPNTRCP
ncbi:hypothetical protein KC19_VG236500 [Ceratodon purpureus]|uniref:Uncharacterized protein n=1 Tax=Ceratodon purpureus TaxID=3225 RepID=A0A8T0HSX1_CERPU|nr:hypothetical protein KC19_VG236500 [Ceratodon purpureus]